jgi:AcrR family transcriptional regulator
MRGEVRQDAGLGGNEQQAESRRLPELQRRLSPQERMPLILEAALAEFAERGYGGARMASVAVRAGIAKSLIYHYFPSKEELFRATVRSFAQPLHAQVAREIAASSASVWDRLRGVIEFGYKRVEEAGRERQLFRVIVTEAELFPEVALLYHQEIHAPGLAIVRQLLEAGVASGEFSPDIARIPALAELLIAPPLMTSVWRMILGEDKAPNPGAMLASQFEALRPLLAKTPAQVRPADR